MQQQALNTAPLAKGNFLLTIVDYLLDEEGEGPFLVVISSCCTAHKQADTVL